MILRQKRSGGPYWAVLEFHLGYPFSKRTKEKDCEDTLDFLGRLPQFPVSSASGEKTNFPGP